MSDETPQDPTQDPTQGQAVEDAPIDAGLHAGDITGDPEAASPEAAEAAPGVPAAAEPAVPAPEAVMPPMPAEPAAPRRHRALAAILGVAAAAAALALAFAFLGPVRVTVDGSAVWVARGTTVAALLQDGRLAAGTPGDLMSVKGRMLKADAGGPPTIHVDGEVATTASVLEPGARISTFHGADAVEQTVTKTLETTPGLHFVGTGPVESVEDSGTPGTVRVVVGALSGEEVSRRVISRGVPATVRREPAWPGRKEVALTFDDGPWPGSTDAVLAELKAAKAKATFFEVGQQVKARPETSKRVLAAGMEIGDHSYSHKYIGSGYPRSVITDEIAWGADAIKSVLGFKPVWYRPAGGSTNPFVFSEAKRLGLRIVLWTIDPHDYQRPGVKVIARRVLDNIRPGSVVLMHDGGGDRSQTLAALKLITKALNARHYSMVTLSQLYRK
jgi:peptidoglycan-N-acetylglucosamine deacetylase